MTDEELRLRWFLRSQTQMKWRRQEPIGRFIVDFLCPGWSLKLTGIST